MGSLPTTAAEGLVRLQRGHERAAPAAPLCASVFLAARHGFSSSIWQVEVDLLDRARPGDMQTPAVGGPSRAAHPPLYRLSAGTGGAFPARTRQGLRVNFPPPWPPPPVHHLRRARRQRQVDPSAAGVRLAGGAGHPAPGHPRAGRHAARRRPARRVPRPPLGRRWTAPSSCCWSSPAGASTCWRSSSRPLRRASTCSATVSPTRREPTRAMAGGCRSTLIDQVDRWRPAAGSPDRTLLFDLPAEDARARGHSPARAGSAATADRLDAEGLEFYERVRRGFLRGGRARAGALPRRGLLRGLARGHPGAGARGARGLARAGGPAHEPRRRRSESPARAGSIRR